MRISGICFCLAALAFGVGCERHSAEETRYFATHHLSKAEKEAAKKAYAARADESAPAAEAGATDAEAPEGRRFFPASSEE